MWRAAVYLGLQSTSYLSCLIHYTARYRSKLRERECDVAASVYNAILSNVFSKAIVTFRYSALYLCIVIAQDSTLPADVL